MSHQTPQHDPHSRFEDEGIPDLQDGTPGQQWAVDPQEAPLPADDPVALDDYGTTADEQVQGEPLDGRLGREEPEEQAVYGAGEHPDGPAEEVGAAPTGRLTADSGLGVGSGLDTRPEPGGGVEPAWPAQPEEPTGQVWDEAAG